MISVTITGAEDIIRRLDATQRNAVYRPPMERAMGRLEATMAEYPPPPSGSRYKRTRNYGRLWTQKIEEDGDGITGILGNAVRDPRYGRAYGPYVGSAERQARVHQGRWTTDEQAIMQNLDAIEGDFAQAVERALDG